MVKIKNITYLFWFFGLFIIFSCSKEKQIGCIFTAAPETQFYSVKEIYLSAIPLNHCKEKTDCTSLLIPQLDEEGNDSLCAIISVNKNDNGLTAFTYSLVRYEEKTKSDKKCYNKGDELLSSGNYDCIENKCSSPYVY